MTKYPEFQGEFCTLLARCSTDYFADVMGCQAALFEWADSYDAKDWDRLRKCVAPSLMVSPLRLDFMIVMTVLRSPGRLPCIPEQEVG